MGFEPMRIATFPHNQDLVLRGTPSAARTHLLLEFIEV